MKCWLKEMQASKRIKKSLLKICLYFFKQRAEDISYSAGVKNSLRELSAVVYKYHLHKV